MRKIKSNFFVSLDGVVESPDKWHFPYFDDEMGAAVGAGFATSDAMLMGRVLYDEWAAYWPEHADDDFGAVMNGMQKYVISSSLETAEWQNTEVVGGDVAGKLAEIKARDGGTRMVLRFTFESRDHMDQLERRGAFAVFPQSVGQMDLVLTEAS